MESEIQRNPEDEIRIPIRTFNQDMAEIVIRPFKGGQFGDHDQIDVILNGEEVGYLQVNMNWNLNEWTKDNQRGFATWFPADRDRGFVGRLSFDMRRTAIETTMIQNHHLREIT